MLFFYFTKDKLRPQDATCSGHMLALGLWGSGIPQESVTPCDDHY